MKTCRNRRTSPPRGGFTLIEMLVVLAILVLIMSMVGPRILGSRDKANVSAAKSQIEMLQASLEHYTLDMNDFPTTEQGLAALVDAPGDKDADSKWDGPYISKSAIPKDPWGREYQYEYPPTHSKEKKPDVWSLGYDGEENTDDDVVSWVREEGEGEGAASQPVRQAQR
jgi:general secretion pathway protein G